MLKTRILTALILIPVVIYGLFGLTGFAYEAFCLIILGAAAWEWGQFAELKGLGKRTAYVATLVFSGVVVGFLPSVIQMLVLVVAAVFWLVSFVWTAQFPELKPWYGGKRMLAMGWVTIVPLWVALLQLSLVESYPSWLIYLLLVVWGCDTGAYFAGKRFGKTKLAPKVSPGKTREGVYGAFVVVTLLSVVAVFSGWLEVNWLGLWVISMLTAVVSVQGDLLESMCKRTVGIKDSGKLLPGHGGVLDRIDSLCAALPFFALLVVSFAV
ncbi:phosphatidate cytidylyltransferase [Pokkaliibacter sp. CJK22405]|uniref:phosphatidate cytidylyltransferase n=1 Tax=Pokkaliibacter sp. CJK22405 TaxID=3384615 RepID=UPI0039848E32